MLFSTDFVAATREYCTFKSFVHAPMFRKEFELGDIKSAELTICGLGFYELFVNGCRITRGHLSPYISNPDHILYYDRYDLTPYLTVGKNVIGIMLGNGNLNNIGGWPWNQHRTAFRSAPKFALYFEAEASDGSKTEFSAKDGFKCADSAIMFDDIRCGEFYDARLYSDGWNKVGYDDSGWRDTLPAETPRGICRLADTDPIVKVEEVRPISIKRGKISQIREWVHPGCTDMTAEEYLTYTDFSPNEEGYIYDFGINRAGICRLDIKNAKPGQRIALQFGEKLSDDGGLDLRGWCVEPLPFNHRDIYICKGGDETWKPTFTYHGFRYVLVMGITDEQAIDELLTFEVMNTDLREIGEFSCSDATVNKLVKAALTADYANFCHFPTDCPHREKLGWTADTALSLEQMLTYLTPERNLKEWLRNVRAAMKENGAIPCYVPSNGYGYGWGAGPAWDMVLTLTPYYIWLYRGDTDVIRENATAIFRYVHYLSTRRDERGLIHIGLGDWAPAARANAEQFAAPLEFTDTAISYDICKKAAKMFNIIGMKAQRDFAAAIADEFRTAARKYLIDKSTLTAYGRCQTTQAMAIYYGIFDDAEKHEAAKRLVDIIHQNGDHIYCGILGVRLIFHVLSEFGYTELAFRMITRPDYPSYGYMMRLYDSSLWESFVPDEGMPASRNHHFLGDIISWFMKNLAGININPRAEDVNEVRFAPKFIDALDHASGSHIVPSGKVSAEWHRVGEDILYTVTVPEGIRAELTLERGWQTEDGFTWRIPKGTVTYRLIHENKKDIKRLTSER